METYFFLQYKIALAANNFARIKAFFVAFKGWHPFRFPSN